MDSAHRESFHSLTQDDLTQPRDTAAGHYLELPPLQPTSYVPTASDNELIAVKAAYENSQKSPDSDEKTHDLRVSTDRKSLSLQVNVDEEQGIHKEYLAENGSPTASTWSVKNHSSKSKRTKYDSARFSDVSLSLFPWANTNSPLRLCDGSGESEATDNQSLLPLSPRKQRMQEREAAYQRFYFVISSPVPYLIFVILLAMIVMIFVDVISISGLVCVTAVLMVRDCLSIIYTWTLLTTSLYLYFYVVVDHHASMG